MKTAIKGIPPPLLWLGAAVGIFFIAKKLLPDAFKSTDKLIKTAVDIPTAVVSTSAQGYKDAYTAAQKTIELITRDGAVKVTGKIILPDRTAIDPAAVRISGEGTFTYGAHRYRLTARDAGGNYPAVRI